MKASSRGLIGVFTRGLPVCLLCPTPTSRNRSKTIENDLEVNFFISGPNFLMQALLTAVRKTRLKKRAKVTEKFETFELFLLDYQMVKCFRQIKTIFSDFGQFFELQISDLNVP